MIKFITELGKVLKTESNKTIIYKLKNTNMNDFFRQGNCGTRKFKGTRWSDCTLQSMGRIVSPILLNPNLKLKPEDLTEANWLKLIKEKKNFPLLGVENAEQNTEEDVTYTSPETGIISLIRKGLPNYTFSFRKGLCGHKKIEDKQGQVWRVALAMERGLLLTTDYKGEYAQGFRSDFLNLETYRLQQGTDPEMSRVTMQFSDADELNKYGVFLSWETLGFNVNQTEGLLEVILDATLKAGTTIEVKATDYCDASKVTLGLEDIANWVVNGVSPDSVAYDTVKKTYTLTVTTALKAGDLATVEVVGEDVEGIVCSGKISGVVASA